MAKPTTAILWEFGLPAASHSLGFRVLGGCDLKKDVRNNSEPPMLMEFSFGPLGFVPLGFGSLNHGIWPSIRVFGTQNLGYKY